MKKTLALVREISILLGASLVLALSYNAFSPKPLPLLRTETTAVASDSLITALATIAVLSDSQQDSSSKTQILQQKPPQQNEPIQTSPQTSVNAQEKNTLAKSPILVKEPVVSAPLPASSKTTSVQSQQEVHQEQAPKPDASTKALEIRFDQVEKLLLSPDVVVIDARPAREFELGHIGNAINIYTPEFEQHIGRIIGLPREKPIITYCGGGACELSHELAENLIKMGFRRVFVYVGGWSEWKQKKL